MTGPIVIDVSAEDFTLEVESAAATVSPTEPVLTVIAVDGPAGPPGAPGNGADYTFLQATPAATWVIPHGLGRTPILTGLTDSDGQVIDTDITLTDTVITIEFAAPVAGSVTYR